MSGRGGGGADTRKVSTGRLRGRGRGGKGFLQTFPSQQQTTWTF